MKSLPLLLIAFLTSSAVVSCVSTGSSRPRGQTDYLDFLGVANPHNGRTAELAGEDTFSFWDDDGTGGPPRIKLDLGEQAAYFYRGNHLVGRSLISSGKEGHPTPTGTFKIFNKDPDHKSSLYGWMLDADGNVVNNNADIRVDKVPPGGRFDPSKMTWFNQFYPAVGMHAGFLPGYAASHGCVRMPEWMARHFYFASPIGTPVTVTY